MAFAPVVNKAGIGRIDNTVRATSSNHLESDVDFNAMRAALPDDLLNPLGGAGLPVNI